MAALLQQAQQQQAARVRARASARGGSGTTGGAGSGGLARVVMRSPHAAAWQCPHGGWINGAVRYTARRGRAAASPGAAPAVEDGSALEAAAAEFAAWYAARARDRPAELVPRRASGPAGGLRMVTLQPVVKGAPLLAVPRALLMSADTARASPTCGPLVEKADLDDWQALVLHLLCERANPASAWAPYMRLLESADVSHHPLLWGAGPRAWLAGSPMARVLEARHQQVERDAEALAAAGANELAIPGGGGGGGGGGADVRPPLVTRDSVAWAAATLLSRAFSLYLASEPDHSISPMDDFGSWSWDRAGADVLALVPWADLLQHSSEAGDASVLRYDVETETAFLCAHRDYGAGEEVCDSYGPGLSPSDTLLDYGFVDAGAANDRYDAAPADIARPRGPRNAALLAALDRLQGEGAMLPLGRSGPDGTGLTLLRASLAGDAELVRAGWRPRSAPGDVGLAARAMGRLSAPESRATEAALLDALAAYAAAAAAAYPTTLAEDEAEAAALEAEARAEGERSGGAAAAPPEARERHVRLQVLRALASEKLCLAGTAAAVARWRARLEGGAPLDEVYAELGEGSGDDDDE